MIICGTGHRPDKLYGYDLNDSRYVEMAKRIKQVIFDEECTHIISGGALGFDTVLALAAIGIRNKYLPELIVEIAVPCRNHDSRWIQSSRNTYKWILDNSNIVTLVNDLPYSPYLMQLRNEYMVNKANQVMACWNGSPGGTANCIAYAKQVNKKVIYIPI